MDLDGNKDIVESLLTLYCIIEIIMGDKILANLSLGTIEN